MANPSPSKVDKAIAIIREFPDTTAFALQKKLNLNSLSIAHEVLAMANQREAELAARLSSENAAAEVVAAAAAKPVRFFARNPDGSLHEMVLGVETERRVIFDFTNELAWVTTRAV